MSSVVVNDVRIIRTQDRIELSHEQIQKVLKEYVEAQTGRKIDGEVSLDTKTKGGLATGVEWRGYCRLLDPVGEPK